MPFTGARDGSFVHQGAGTAYILAHDAPQVSSGDRLRVRLRLSA